MDSFDFNDEKEDLDDSQLEEDLNTKLNNYFAGRIVRKDLTKKMKNTIKNHCRKNTTEKIHPQF